ncbi:MAG TPA: hypothetical protein VIU34_09325 [Steroidobacter sp.]
MVAERDEIIPRSSTDDLYARFRAGVATLRVIADVGHNTISATPLYVETLQMALAQNNQQ